MFKELDCSCTFVWLCAQGNVLCKEKCLFDSINTPCLQIYVSCLVLSLCVQTISS